MALTSLRKKSQRVKVIVMQMPEQKPLKSWTIYGVPFEKIVEALIKTSEELENGSG